MFKVKKSQVVFDDDFLGDGSASDVSIGKLRDTLYMAEGWSIRADDEYDIVSFDDIKKFFDSWDQCEVDKSERYRNEYDYLIDCLGQGFHPVKEILTEPEDIDPETFECRFVGRSGSVITIDRYGQDDYSATWDDSCSVRGTFAQVAFEIMKEV